MIASPPQCCWRVPEVRPAHACEVRRVRETCPSANFSDRQPIEQPRSEHAGCYFHSRFDQLPAECLAIGSERAMECSRRDGKGVRNVWRAQLRFRAAPSDAFENAIPQIAALWRSFGKAIRYLGGGEREQRSDLIRKHLAR